LRQQRHGARDRRRRIGGAGKEEGLARLVEGGNPIAERCQIILTERARAIGEAGDLVAGIMRAGDDDQTPGAGRIRDLRERIGIGRAVIAGSPPP
jgi:hypothetical protein